MNAPPTARRRASMFRRIGWLAIAAMATLALAGPAAGPVLGASVPPIFIEGAANVSCSDLDDTYGNGQTWSEFKLQGDDLADGAYTIGDLTVTISNFTAPGEQGSFDWSSSFGVDAVLVKTGVAGKNLYVYDPPAESFGDTDLRTPTGSGNGFSHISFCYDAGNPPPPPPDEVAELVVLKWLDLDSDPLTTNDIVPASGWQFDVTVAGGTATPSSGTTVIDDGGTPADPADDVAYVKFEIGLGGDGTEVSVTEVIQEDYTLLDAFCRDLETKAARGTLGDGEVTDVEINADETVVCEFTNTSGGEAGATATPNVTLPPTDATPIGGTPAGDGWRLALLAVAGILATLLLLTPAPAKARRRR